ncbi:MAG: sulfatase-like hydrolase/transferase [Alphaproteobacteria bacterium]|jgi:phosphoglycerol transferase MdoB-like AlkP superfamily enzyme|nr:sulfatase-like hydrolase/transferase [Alphaproteobacteria bacterium]MBT4086238.1 sulfatase-like hydrolase/transferase [Alphaproteobacteria bacterium]MBT4543855.1 sulfatase-like hydrolase/transferase [Alphaproteobacteria bacterium]
MTRGVKRLIWIAVSFLLVSFATRTGLAIFSGGSFSVFEWLRFYGVGLLFDITVLPWFLAPWAIYDAAMPEWHRDHRLHKWESRWAALAGCGYLVLFSVVATAEFTFWAEFGNRFDFIAVDYLVYTHEVIGNIRESYPINLWTSIIVAICLVITWISWPRGGKDIQAPWLRRWSRVVAVALVAALGFFFVDQKSAETKSNAFVTQLSNNGFYALFHAYRHNQLDYEKYYPTLKASDLDPGIRALVEQPGATFVSDTGIERKIAAHSPMKDVNVVLVSVESLSADYVGRFGNKDNLTPELDKLADKGLWFTKLYATGTRTVRGLEALSVGTPPTPGQSIVRRPDNDGLVNLGGTLKDKGWTPWWVYGGYGFFDNMNAYFAGNGFNVADRTDVDNEGIKVHAENIWGIADEDLYTLAMTRIDREFANGKRFFAHVMTTSNHRPYTFPEGRVEQPQKKREGAVQYTDWAIGDFLRRAADKPWFKNTLFIIVSDHTAKAAGKTDLPLSRYHIPMVWYAPDLIKPGTMDRLMSQIDIGPTLLGWLGLDYSSRFFGYDMFTLKPGRERAFISTYQKLGYLKDDRLVVLDVRQEPVVQKGLPASKDGTTLSSDAELIDEAISWYQSAALYFRTGLLKQSAGLQKK